MEIITFISNYEMYDKEESGIKPNTFRVLRFNNEQKLRLATHVKIRRGYTKRFFIRKITDKTKWDNNWIISWNPNENLSTRSSGKSQDKQVPADKLHKVYGKS